MGWGTRHSAATLFFTTALAVLPACAGPSKWPPSGATPVGPSQATASQPAATVLPAPDITLSGRIFEVLADGTRRPVGVGKVDVEVEVDSPLDPKRGGWVSVGTDGSYRISGVPDNRFVKIAGVAITGIDVYGGGPNARHRLCGVSTVTGGDTTLDIPFFLPGAAVPGPVLSGQVFTVVDGKPIPFAGVDVYYKSRAYGPDVWDYTDRDGRYSLCGIPRMPGTLYMVCGNDVTAHRHPLDIREDTVVDIDATAFRSCL